jgi:hypothetical protein
MLKLKKIRPMFNQLVTTMDRYDMDQVEMVLSLSQQEV